MLVLMRVTRSAVMRNRASTSVLLLLFGLIPAQAQLRGHGGPVRALAIAPDGETAVSGSFDTSAILWSLRSNTAEQVLQFHDGAVNAVAILPDRRIATAGGDFRIAIWQPAAQTPQTVLEGHTAPVVALAVSPDGKMLASASWDRTTRLWPLGGGVARVLEGHQQQVNGVAFLPDGSAAVSVGYDATLRIWPLIPTGAPTVTLLPTPLNAVAVAPNGEIVTAGADGDVYFFSPNGQLRGNVHAGETPLIALAISPDGSTIAAASIRGSVAIVERASRKVVRTLVGPGLADLVSSIFSRQSHFAHRRCRSHHTTLEREQRRSYRCNRCWGTGRSTCGVCRRSRRTGVSRLRRLPHSQAR